MPLIRIDAETDRPVLHRCPRPHDLSLEIARRDPVAQGPVVIMIHGYKYAPGHPRACPHTKIFADRADVAHSWPRNLGFGLRYPDEGLGIAFGWSARGSLKAAQRRAVSAGRALVDLVTRLRALWPERPVHLITHSMGSEVAFEALHHLQGGAIGRLVVMSAASFQPRARAALQSPAGQTTEVINITSRENDLFDFLHERLLGSGIRSDRSLGAGLEVPGALTLQLDCPATLDHLTRLGRPVAPPQHRICHWSAYTRPGALRLYAALLRQPDRFSLAQLRAGLPAQTAPRWSRLINMAKGDLRSLFLRGLSPASRLSRRARSCSVAGQRSATT